ncbi:hypothetical protein IT571_06600 [Candidatus Sumerlaeota bacterium]|nr:hypothetical protein [Candidatus Sumerlaeota bacterium]
MIRQFFKALLWGNSIALCWTWGLGLFFSVQIALHFGLVGLLSFAIPNALGLVFFGLLTQTIANRYPNPKDFERHFFKTSETLKYVFLLYQIVAISLTFFAIFKYLFLPMGVNMGLAALVMVGAAFLLGQQFDIRRIKWTHLAMTVVIAASVTALLYSLHSYIVANNLPQGFGPGHKPAKSWAYVGYLIPMIVGLFVGPWLDLQQWQRAVQIHREQTSLRLSWFLGAIIFFGILIFHGTFALSLLGATSGAPLPAEPGGLFHAKEFISNFLFAGENSVPRLFRVAYVAFIFLCIVSTLDSGYIALKWYLTELVRKSEHIIFTIVPEVMFRSPEVVMSACVGIAVASWAMGFELEYFMSFYASFFVGYAIVFLFRSTYKPQFTNFAQTTLFSVAAFALGLFGIGYFENAWYFMVLGAVVPAVQGIVTISSRVVVDDLQKALPRPDSTDEVPMGSVSGKAAHMAVVALENAVTRLNPKAGEQLKDVLHNKIEPTAAQALATVLNTISPSAVAGAPVVALPINADADVEHARGHFEGKWFRYTFMATYQDTNSVGNVYFGMYPMWVGKVREMFFQACMPNFDLKKTPFYILTRSFEHKFNLEAREFEIVTVKIRVEAVNRKFVTLEHHIYNQALQILGKGRQVLMFVSSKDYGLVDLPQEVKLAFLPYTP